MCLLPLHICLCSLYFLSLFGFGQSLHFVILRSLFHHKSSFHSDVFLFPLAAQWFPTGHCLSEFHQYWQASLFSLSPCHTVTSRCPSLSLWLSPTQNRCGWSTVRTPPHQPVQQAPHLPVSLQGALPLGQKTRARIRGRPSYQQIQRQAKTSSTWNREWPDRLAQLTQNTTYTLE